MNLTIERVFPKIREWQGQYGPGAAVKVQFTDGSHGDYATKPDKAPRIMEELTALIGKPGEFEVEDKPDYDGIPQRKIRSWPGKQQPGQFGGGGGGGGRAYVPAWGNTEEGERFIQDQMNVRTACMQAVEMWKVMGGDPGDCFRLWEEILCKIRASASVPTVPQTATPVSTPETASAPSPVPTDGKANGSKPNLTPEEAACRQGMVWLKAWMAECNLPANETLRCQIATEALETDSITSMKQLTAKEWERLKAYCQNLKDGDIKAWQAVAENAVGAK